MTDPVKPVLPRSVFDPVKRFRLLDADVMLTSSLTRSEPDPGFDPTRSTLTRSTTQLPVPRASTRFHTRRAFWWRVRARVRSFLGNLDIYKLVSKFSTMWYIYFTCLKLLQIRKYVKNSMYAYFLGYFCAFSCISLWFWKYV